MTPTQQPPIEAILAEVLGSPLPFLRWLEQHVYPTIEWRVASWKGIGPYTAVYLLEFLMGELVLLDSTVDFLDLDALAIYCGLDVCYLPPWCSVFRSELPLETTSLQQVREQLLTEVRSLITAQNQERG